MIKISKSKSKIEKRPNAKITLELMLKQKTLIFMSLPFVIWIIIFAYVPLWGWTMAFQDFKPGQSFFQQDFVGLKHFIKLFNDKAFANALRNTLAMSSLGIIFGFTTPIIFAILLNEIASIRFKRFSQTVSYLPHFISWVTAAAIVTTMLSNGGIVNEILIKLHIIDKPFSFMTHGVLFWFIVVFSDIWKEVGWGAIIYLAAIAGIDPTLYEAATMDGAGRWRKIINITIPTIAPTIILLFIMNVGNIINIGFEKQLLLGNSTIKNYSNVIDWYALTFGINMSRYSYGTAIGIFKSVISLTIMVSLNTFMKKKKGISLY